MHEPAYVASVSVRHFFTSSILLGTVDGGGGSGGGGGACMHLTKGGDSPSFSSLSLSLSLFPREINEGS